jgi:hypothetical protein
MVANFSEFFREKGKAVVSRTTSYFGLADTRQETLLIEICGLREELRKNDPDSIRDQEFKAFSQFGEDGILSWLTRDFCPADRTFVEIGVGSYDEANTRYLASKSHNPWKGVIIDCNADHLNFGIHPDSWKWNVSPVQALVTSSNINDILLENDIRDEIGIFSLDIDSTDYWVWNSVVVIQPKIVVLEFNYVFGPTACVTSLNSNDSRKPVDDRSGQFFGASLQAMVALSAKKGYTFVGTTSTGVNSFFVRDDLVSKIWPGYSPLEVSQQWVDGGFANVRDHKGSLLRLSLAEKQAMIDEHVVFDCSTETQGPLRNFLRE